MPELDPDPELEEPEPVPPLVVPEPLVPVPAPLPGDEVPLPEELEPVSLVDCMVLPDEPVPDEPAELSGAVEAVVPLVPLAVLLGVPLTVPAGPVIDAPGDGVAVLFDELVKPFVGVADPVLDPPVVLELPATACLGFWLSAPEVALAGAGMLGAFAVSAWTTLAIVGNAAASASVVTGAVSSACPITTLLGRAADRTCAG